MKYVQVCYEFQGPLKECYNEVWGRNLKHNLWSIPLIKGFSSQLLGFHFSLVVAGVLSATRPEESLRFETLYQALVDGKSGKACAKIYPGNCGGQDHVMDLSGIVSEPVNSSPQPGQNEEEDVGSAIKVTPVQSSAASVGQAHAFD